MTYEIKQTIAPKGYLRVGINMSNFLLVVGKNENGDPIGISPDIAKLIAKAPKNIEIANAKTILRISPPDYGLVIHYLCLYSY